MSSPNWWGDWRPTLTPHTGNLLATDLIECTMIVGGLPVNTVITGAQILGAVPSGGGLTVGTTAIASGTVGRILFEGTGNVLQQSANLFWDNTNGRLGIGQSTPTARIHIQGSSALSANSSLVVFNSTPTEIFRIRDNGNVQIGALTDAGYKLDVNGTARIKGTGTTSATNALSIQDSLGSNTLLVKDDKSVFLSSLTTGGATSVTDQQLGRLYFESASQWHSYIGSTRNGGTGDTSLALFGLGTGGGYQGGIRFFTSSNSATPVLAMIVDRNQSVGIGLTNSTNLTVNASAKVQIDSTTKGFLPPRMTTAQKNAIASPAAGLVVYDTTLNKLCVRTASAWETITSL